MTSEASEIDTGTGSDAMDRKHSERAELDRQTGQRESEREREREREREE